MSSLIYLGSCFGLFVKMTLTDTILSLEWLVVQPQPQLLSSSKSLAITCSPSQIWPVWSPADDTVTIIGPTTDSDAQLHDKRLHHLARAPDRAPRLMCISCLIACVHYDIPQCCSPLKTACDVVHAILETARILFNGIVET